MATYITELSFLNEKFISKHVLTSTQTIYHILALVLVGT